MVRYVKCIAYRALLIALCKGLDRDMIRGLKADQAGQALASRLE